MTYVLVLIQFMQGNFWVTNETAYGTMDQCFDARDILVENLGRPIINYQAVCILRKKE